MTATAGAGASASGPQGPSLDKLLAQLDRELDNFASLVPPSPRSKPRTPFDADTPFEDRSLAKLRLREILTMVPKMLALMFAMRLSARMYRPFASASTTVTPELLAELEAGAARLGAKSVRYVAVPPAAIFAGKGLPARFAIVIAVEMDKARIETAPSFTAMLEVVRGYRNLAKISNWIARRLRRAGHAAYPGTALGGLTDYPHIAELAGMGAIGYHGLLITPESGARLRINTIYTDIENLPITHKSEHLWIRDFCASCHKCVRKCPVDAIYQEPRPRGDGGMQCIDHGKCRDYFDRNFGCAVCLAVCPFSHTGYEQIKARFKGNPRAPRFEIPVRLPIVPADQSPR